MIKSSQLHQLSEYLEKKQGLQQMMRNDGEHWWTKTDCVMTKSDWLLDHLIDLTIYCSYHPNPPSHPYTHPNKKINKQKRITKKVGIREGILYIKPYYNFYTFPSHHHYLIMWVGILYINFMLSSGLPNLLLEGIICNNN